MLFFREKVKVNGGERESKKWKRKKGEKALRQGAI